MRSEVMEHLTQAILLNPASASLVYNARPSQFRVMAKGYSSIDDDSIPGLELDSDSETIIQDSRKVVLENNQIFADQILLGYLGSYVMIYFMMCLRR
ncbi:uncharacterized protein LOC135151667 isoform X2 [Daucus carota subsp. sativus]|uniref:uncharacterized protein LOC135151667 isoform X2 n=1 Tax=Daucus carota subsp. sativus TaxID=79200 RepID=UPI0030827E24